MCQVYIYTVPLGVDASINTSVYILFPVKGLIAKQLPVNNFWSFLDKFRLFPQYDRTAKTAIEVKTKTGGQLPQAKTEKKVKISKNSKNESKKILRKPFHLNF